MQWKQCVFGALVAGVMLASAHAQCDGQWRVGDGGVPGVSGRFLTSTVWDPDGEHGPGAPQLMLGGLCNGAGGVASRNLVGWDGREWHAIGSPWTYEGLRIMWNPTQIQALAVYHGDLIA